MQAPARGKAHLEAGNLALDGDALAGGKCNVQRRTDGLALRPFPTGPSVDKMLLYLYSMRLTPTIFSNYYEDTQRSNIGWALD